MSSSHVYIRLGLRTSVAKTLSLTTNESANMQPRKKKINKRKTKKEQTNEKQHFTMYLKVCWLYLGSTYQIPAQWSGCSRLPLSNFVVIHNYLRNTVTQVAGTIKLACTKHNIIYSAQVIPSVTCLHSVIVTLPIVFFLIASEFSNTRRKIK